MSESTVNKVEEAPPKEEEENGKEDEYDPYFAPIVTLPEIHVYTNEEMEEVMVKLRAKLYRYDSSCDPPEWKERGTGEVKLLRHMDKPVVRVVMRRDKTLKVCANHFVGPWMTLKPNCGSDRAWVWSVNIDYADEEPKPELLAIKFANTIDAKKWFDAFEAAKRIVRDGKEEEKDSGGEDEEDSEEEKEEKEAEEDKKEEKEDKETEELSKQLKEVTV